MRSGMRSMYVLFILVVVCPHMVTMLTCWEGTYVHKFDDNRQDICTECPDGTVMPHTQHEYTSCIPCEEIRNSDLEILVSPCNKTHQAVIHCINGYYRDLPRNLRETPICKECTECPSFTGRPCGTYRDTICCWDENYEVVPNHDGVLLCRERPWFCRRGQYFETKYFQCLQCPDNTFMPLDYHVQPECWKCREYHKYESYRPLHSVIIQPCNSTHAPTIRCEDGFFVNPKMSYRGDATGCSPCTDCSKTDAQYEGRKCDGMEDTVCCPQANMAIIDTSNGPVCCSEANMTVVDTSEGPVCRATSTNLGPIPPVSSPDQTTTTDPRLRDVLSADCDSRSVGGFVSGILSTGILVGIVLTLVYCLIYRRFFRRGWHRWLNTRKRSSRSESDVQTEDGEAEEYDFLQGASKDSGNQTRLRNRVAGAIYEGAERLRNRIPGFGMQQTTNDDYGRVQCCGDESDLYSRKESCANKTDHAKCVSVQDFDIQHLGEGFSVGGKMAYVKAVRDLTVRLKVNHTSRGRPKNYPCRNLGGNVGGGIKRFGTGLVYQVRKKFADVSNTKCPCRYCSVYKNEANMKWAEFAVVTAAQIVYDNDECKRTSCRLWFDSDEDFVHAPSLKGRAVKPFHKSQDFRVLFCVTHDQAVSQKLEGMVARFNELRRQYKATSEDVNDNDKLAVLISQQHGLSKKIQTGKATMKMDGEIQKWSYDIQTCPGSCGAPVCILGKGQGSGILTTIHSMENENTGVYI